MENGVLCVHSQGSKIIITFINKIPGARKIRTEEIGRQIYFPSTDFARL
nr:MAG TPA: hypothetical protein [Caudoviricetes sp.]